MSYLSTIYKQSLSLMTDLYQLTMAYGYWKNGDLDTQSCFHLFFRKPPFGGGYAVACGLEPALEYLEGLRFSDSDIDYLGTLTGNDGKELFEKGFLEYLRHFELQCEVHAVPEGSVVFPFEPMLRVQGPLLHCQLLETPLLNFINFQTLIATKAARITQATRGEPVLEFGMRRAQGPDGALSAARASFVGGVAATSNVLAGKILGIPVSGTHAHSWVMSFDTELEAFEAYAKAMPNNCVFLVDTYDTLQGVRHAIEVGKKIREQGHQLVGIRLDSGDLAWLSIEARRLLDEHGFQDAKIYASNDLDENTITSLKEQGAKIGMWGVGTRLATGHQEAALGGVYKLSAVHLDGHWQPRIKLSEQAIKIPVPGRLQIRRYSRQNHQLNYEGDLIYDIGDTLPERPVMIHPMDPTKRHTVRDGDNYKELLEPVYANGKRTQEEKSLSQIQQHAKKELSHFHSGVKRLLNPHSYPAGLEEGLHHRKMYLILKTREKNK